MVANWKMHATVPEAVGLAGRIEDGLADFAQGGQDLPEIVVCPPYTALTGVNDVFDERILKIGAQDVHWADAGPHTGEVSGPMLQGLAEYVIVGHPDRRKAGERDETVARKLAAALRHNLIPILCVGEEDANDIATEESERVLEAGLADVEPGKAGRILVAYEPFWAINSGQAADTNQVAEVTAHLQESAKSLGLKDAKVLYGGSITPDNFGQFKDIDSLDGVVLGAASLQPETFLQVVGRLTEK